LKGGDWAHTRVEQFFIKQNRSSIPKHHSQRKEKKMKKILAIAAALMLLVPAAYALESIEDMDLDNVTGQAGISLTNYTGNMTIGITLEGVSWGDPDGASVLGPATAVAGHIKIHALSAALAASTIGINIQQLQGNEVKIEVDQTGIYVDSGTTSISVSPPPVLRISVDGAAGTGSVADWSGVASESVTLGDLGLGSLNVSVTTPSVLKISPIP
jgi:hypothetical protein